MFSRLPSRTPRFLRPLSTVTSISTPKPLRSILIANRGEIALRVQRTASQHGIRVTTVYTDPDARAPHALVSPFSVNLGSTEKYLDIEGIIGACKRMGAEGVHPGYGFVSFSILR